MNYNNPDTGHNAGGWGFAGLFLVCLPFMIVKAVGSLLLGIAQDVGDTL